MLINGPQHDRMCQIQFQNVILSKVGQGSDFRSICYSDFAIKRLRFLYSQQIQIIKNRFFEHDPVCLDYESFLHAAYLLRPLPHFSISARIGKNPSSPHFPHTTAADPASESQWIRNVHFPILMCIQRIPVMVIVETVSAASYSFCPMGLQTGTQMPHS